MLDPLDLRPLTGRRALICGASRGIGRAAAVALAKAGASCVLLGRSADSLESLRGDLPNAGDAAHAVVVADQSDIDALRAHVAGAVSPGRPIHIWVNNTGGPKGGPLAEAEPDALERAFRQHVLAAQTILHVLLPGMRAAGYGRIVNVISTSVKQPIPGLGVSNTIRGAMANWAKTLAGELGPDGITVNNVLPGFTATARLREIIAARAAAAGTDPDAIAEQMRASVPAGRFADPHETAAAIAWLASPAAAYVNGVNLPIDGGRTMSL